MLIFLLKHFFLGWGKDLKGAGSEGPAWIESQAQNPIPFEVLTWHKDLVEF
jgi:hypothetical protein